MSKYVQLEVLMDKELRRFAPTAEAVAMLFYPHVEVVLHNLRTGLIEAVYNSFSKRKIGDESLLEGLDNIADLPNIIPPYVKTNWDGRHLKSISSVLRDRSNSPIGLMCMNVDLSQWDEMARFAAQFMQVASTDPIPDFLFKDDWREKINHFVTDFLQKERMSLKTLSKSKRRELVVLLYHKGAFQAKNAAAYIADVLDLSRATIYNYLR